MRAVLGLNPKCTIFAFPIYVYCTIFAIAARINKKEAGSGIYFQTILHLKGTIKRKPISANFYLQSHSIQAVKADRFIRKHFM